MKRKSFLRTHSKAQVVSYVGLIPLVENKPKVPGLPQTGTFGEDGSLRRFFSTWWYYHPVPKVRHRYWMVLLLGTNPLISPSTYVYSLVSGGESFDITKYLCLPFGAGC